MYWIVTVRPTCRIVLGTDWDALATQHKGVRDTWGDLEYTFGDKACAHAFMEEADLKDEAPIVEIAEIEGEPEAEDEDGGFDHVDLHSRGER